MVTSDPKISSINLSARCRRGAAAMSSLSREVMCLLRVDIADDSDDSDI